jgi:hypothetical protein
LDGLHQQLPVRLTNGSGMGVYAGCGGRIAGGYGEMTNGSGRPTYGSGTDHGPCFAELKKEQHDVVAKWPAKMAVY